MRKNVLLYTVALIFTCLTSLTHIAGKEAVSTLSPWVVGFGRFMIGAIVMWVIMRLLRRTITVERSDRWRFFTLAFLAVPLNQLSFLVGVQYTPASHPALLYATTPAWVLLFTLWLGMERLRWWKWLGISLSILGVLVLMGGEIFTFQKETAFADAVLLLAVLSWSLYTTLGKPIVERYGALETTFMIIVMGALMYFPFGLVAAVTADYSGATYSAWLGMLYMGIFTSAVCYYLWYWLLERIRPSQVAVTTCGQPPITALFVWLIFGTVPSGNLWLSGGLVLAGVVLTVGYGGPKRGMLKH